MQTVKVRASTEYDVLIERGILKRAGELIKEYTGAGRALLITDRTVDGLYSKAALESLKSAGINCEKFVFEDGEEHKSLKTVGDILSFAAQLSLNRSDIFIALGGGIVGDVTGFAASAYLRGVRFVQIPTTLLAAVDSSVGGKTAVDLGDYKNIIGAFHLPEKVLVSTHFLYTLPDREWLCGMGEIIKTAFLDRKVYEILDGSPEKLLERDEAVLEACVHECITYKRELTARDLYESGPRKALNVGHTIGHALEKTDKHRRSHGEYVLMGMEIESFILGDRMDCERRKEISAFVAETGVDYPDFNPEEVAAACMKDKKNGGGAISVMLPDYENTREVRLSFDEVLRGVTLWKLSR